MAVLALMIVLLPVTSQAGTWKKNSTGWWWQEDNGSYPVSQWKWLDGNKDGIYECYAFDSNGYIYTNTTTPDGYTVNADGAWTIGNSVQLKYQKDMDSQNNSGNASDNNQSTSSDDSIVYTNEDMVGTFMTNDENREDYFELMSVQEIPSQLSTMTTTVTPISTILRNPVIQNIVTPPIPAI